MSLRVKQIFAFLLLFVFCLYTTPKEVYHVFTHHTDTEHTSSKSGLKSGLEISNQHHHCELLKSDQHFAAHNIEIPFYDFSIAETFFIVSTKVATEKFISRIAHSCKQLRAPPSCKI